MNTWVVAVVAWTKGASGLTNLPSGEREKMYKFKCIHRYHTCVKCDIPKSHVCEEENKMGCEGTKLTNKQALDLACDFLGCSAISVVST